MARALHIPEADAARMREQYAALNEVQGRQYLGREARDRGRGGVAAVARAVGVDPRTVARGKREVELDPQTIASLDRMTEILTRELTDAEKERIAPIFAYLKEHDTIDKSIAMQVTGKSSATATRYLNRLVDMGVLIPEGRARGRIYRRL